MSNSNYIYPRPQDSDSPSRSVALFVTCLADLMRPSVAHASIELLQRAGCEVLVPVEQSCCGQPGYNNGDYAGASAIARQLISRFEHFDYVVLPSGSCAGMLKKHYPKLLDGDWRDRAERFASRVHELTSFLVDICDYQPAAAAPDASDALQVAYHDGCAGLRELGLRQQPRQLLAKSGIGVQELSQRDVCCGFGGTFCAKMPNISADMADQKLADIRNTGATTVLGGDLGCLLALAGRARRVGDNTQFRHISEVLAGDSSAPPIGESEPG